MEYRVCVCASSLVGKERSKETKWSYERVERAACVVGRARVICSQKVMFAVGGNKLWSHREFMFLVVSGRSGMSPENVAQSEVVARCRNGITHRHRYSQFWG